MRETFFLERFQTQIKARDVCWGGGKNGNDVVLGVGLVALCLRVRTARTW